MHPPIVAALAVLLTLGSATASSAQRTVTLPQRDRVLDGRPQVAFSIGTAEGEDWEMFADVAALAFDDAGNLYVLDRGNHRVLVYAPDGAFVRQIGKQGGGPGELQGPTAMTVTRDGHVVITDLGRMAFSVFRAGGAFVRNVPFGDGIPGMELHPHPREGVVLTRREMVMRMERREPPALPANTVPILWHALRDSAASKLYEAATPAPQVSTRAQGGNMTRFAALRAFSPTVRWAVLPDGGLAVANEVGYAVQVIEPGGNVRGTITRDVRPRHVTDRDREAAREARREQLESGRGAVRVVVENGRMSMSSGGRTVPAEMIERQLEQLEFEEVVPVIRTIAADPRGVLWIAREGGAGARGGPIDLVRATGEYLGTVVGQEVPRAFSRDGRAAYVRVDDVGIERIIVARLPSGWR